MGCPYNWKTRLGNLVIKDLQTLGTFHSLPLPGIGSHLHSLVYGCSAPFSAYTFILLSLLCVFQISLCALWRSLQWHSVTIQVVVGNSFFFLIIIFPLIYKVASFCRHFHAHLVWSDPHLTSSSPLSLYAPLLLKPFYLQYDPFHFQIVFCHPPCITILLPLRPLLPFSGQFLVSCHNT